MGSFPGELGWYLQPPAVRLFFVDSAWLLLSWGCSATFGDFAVSFSGSLTVFTGSIFSLFDAQQHLHTTWAAPKVEAYIKDERGWHHGRSKLFSFGCPAFIFCLS
jgi:hypothetical protein